MTHLSYWTLAPGELTSPVLRPRVTARSDRTLIQVRECRRLSVISELKDTASFPHFLSTGQSKYVALHFVKPKVVRPQLFWICTVKLCITVVISPFVFSFAHTVIH